METITIRKTVMFIYAGLMKDIRNLSFCENQGIQLDQYDELIKHIEITNLKVVFLEDKQCFRFHCETNIHSDIFSKNVVIHTCHQHTSFQKIKTPKRSEEIKILLL